MTAAVIFVGAYAAIAAGRVPFLRLDRTGAAIVGAILMVVAGVVDFDRAVAAVDVRTIVLLFSMMVIVAHLRLSGGVSVLARQVSVRVTNPVVLVAALVFSSGVLSALFVNDTVCLVFTPIVLDVAARRSLPPLPLLLALATGANIGSTATLVGNPQNMLIGSLAGMSFSRFSAALGPVALIGLTVDAALLALIYGPSLRRAVPPASTAVRAAPVHRALLVKTLIITTAVLSGFLAGYETAVVAAAGAAALLVTRRVRPRKVFETVDWDLLLLFIALFVIVGAGEAAGIDRTLFEWLRPLGVTTIAGLTATTALVSNAVSNVPAVMLLAPLVPKLPDPERAWLVVAMASTLAGNVTILGSIANLIVVEGARRRGVEVTFAQYAAFGMPLSFLTLALGAWWLS